MLTDTNSIAVKGAEMKDAIIQDIQDQILTAREMVEKHGVTRQYVHQVGKLIGLGPYKKPAKAAYQRKKPKEVDDGLSNQRSKYTAHKAHAARRGIEFHLTFGEWWSLWEPHYHNRGRGKGKLCMCRTLDRGPYAVGNVRIDYNVSNGHEKVSSRIENKGTRWMGAHTPAGCGRHLPNCLLICQEDTLEEDPFIYYA